MLTKSIKEKTLNLSPKDKANLIELLMQNMDKPDLKIEKKWIDESEKRISAHKRGELKSIPYSEVKKQYER